MRDYGEALKYQRENSELTQPELANKIGTSQQNISRWERNEVLPNIDFCVQLAKFYGITLDELIGISDDFGVRSAPTASAMREPASLTEKEKALISAFRKLLPETQDFVLRAVGITDKKLFNKN